MKRVLISLVIFHLAHGVAGKGGRNGLFARFDLRHSCAGWQVGFADYRADQESFYELTWACVNDGTALNRGLFISGNNHSDDLFMFIKRPIHGLKPRTVYEVEAQVEFLSKAPTGCLGTGGDPGANVYVKFGAAPEEPTPFIDADGRVGLNVDIGHQSNRGADAVGLGNIATGFTDCHNERYEAKELETPSPVITRSDERGTLWVFVGTDSGFEGITSLFYTGVRVHIRPHKTSGGRDRGPWGQSPKASQGYTHLPRIDAVHRLDIETTEGPRI
jgi:hypothetical protein